MVAAENDAIPGAKVGGIADVLRDVPIALAEKNVAVDVVIPDHNLFHRALDSKLISEIDVSFRGHNTPVFLYQLTQEKQTSLVKQYVIWHSSFTTNGLSNVYCHDDDSRPFASDANKFALFCAAVCEFVLAGHFSLPQVLHLHDWHAATMNVLIEFDPRYQKLSSIKRIFTVHNIALQGIRPFKHDESSLEAWFPQLSYQGHLICDNQHLHCFNPMRAGINLSDKVHLVSPNYCLEVIQASDASCGFYGGEGLEQDLQNAQAQQKLVGILNGCDYSQTEPSQGAIQRQSQRSEFLTLTQQCLRMWMAKDTRLRTSHYFAYERTRDWLAFDHDKGLLVTSIGRLTKQKIGLLLEPLNNAEEQKVLAQLLAELNDKQGKYILLGNGSEQLEQSMTQLMIEHGNFLFINGYDDKLSQQLYDLGELFLMPSSFEPCGISQMLAMRAGQPCLVHQVGGLKDTVHHLETGFSFSGESIQHQVEQLIDCFKQALIIYHEESERYQQIVDTAKQRRFSWNTSVEGYICELYQ